MIKVNHVYFTYDFREQGADTKLQVLPRAGGELGSIGGEFSPLRKDTPTTPLHGHGKP